MRTIVTLSCLIAAAAACIPTKHPEPGIPATPSPVKKCPAYPAATMASQCMPPPGACNLDNPPMISESTISCIVGFVMFIETNPATGAPRAWLSTGEVTCVNGVWTGTDGEPAVGIEFTPPGRLGCSL